jgi:chaperonin GroEL
MSYELYPKEILYDEEMYKRMMAGVEAVHDAVGRTMGPSGQLVMFEEDEKIPYPVVTKDGVSVASMIAFSDQAKDNGAQFVIQAANKQVLETGDGTSLASILTYKILKDGHKLMTAGYSQNEIVSGIKEAVNDVEKYLTKIANNEVDVDSLKCIARVSTNNDAELADIIAKAVYKTGKYGVVFQERSASDKHEIEYQDGYQLNIGIMAQEFANVQGKIMVLKNPYVLITDHNIYNASTLMPLLRQIKDSNLSLAKPELVIIAPQISQEVLQVMKRNITDPEGQFFMVHIRPSKDLKPESNNIIMQDIAAITGGMFISKDSGYQIDKLSLDQLGICDSIFSNPEKTLISGNSESVKNRIEGLKAELIITKDEYTQKLIEKSLAKLTGGVATIKVGGRNLSEQTEILARVDDAIRACKSAQEMGYVRGGGVAMLEAYMFLADQKQNNPGYSILMESLKYPAKVILTNAKREDWQSLIDGVIKGVLGYDIRNGNNIDMYDINIIDPAKVIIYALKNAASAAISMLQTSVMIIGERKEEK